MLGKKVEYDYVPYFWTRQWDKTLQYTGYGSTYNDVFFVGDFSELKINDYYLKHDKVKKNKKLKKF